MDKSSSSRDKHGSFPVDIPIMEPLLFLSRTWQNDHEWSKRDCSWGEPIMSLWFNEQRAAASDVDGSTKSPVKVTTCTLA